MTKRELNKRVKEIYAKYGIKINKNGYGFTDSPFGEVSIRVEKDALFMRFLQNFDIQYFYRYFSKHEPINRFSKKWNLHNTDTDFILNELEERIDNLHYILKNDGKVNVENYKPFLEEIETI